MYRPKFPSRFKGLDTGVYPLTHTLDCKAAEKYTEKDRATNCLKITESMGERRPTKTRFGERTSYSGFYVTKRQPERMEEGKEENGRYNNGISGDMLVTMLKRHSLKQ